MNYQPFFGMNILVSNEFVAILHYSMFNLFVILLIVALGIYQTQRSIAARKGQA